MTDHTDEPTMVDAAIAMPEATDLLSQILRKQQADAEAYTRFLEEVNERARKEAYEQGFEAGWVMAQKRYNVYADFDHAIADDAWGVPA